MLSHRTPTKPGELRKNEPNPMGLLAPIGKLVNHLTEDLVLRIQKSNEIRIGHPRSVVQAMAVLECDRLAITVALPHLRHLSLLTKRSSRRSRFHKGVWGVVRANIRDLSHKRRYAEAIERVDCSEAPPTAPAENNAPVSTAASPSVVPARGEVPLHEALARDSRPDAAAKAINGNHGLAWSGTARSL